MALLKNKVFIRDNKWYGCRRDVRDPRDHRFLALPMALPPSVDLRPDCPEVMDQDARGSCVAHGVIGSMRYLLVMKGGPRDHHLSRLQLYYDAREIEGTSKEDSGCEIRDAIKCAAKIGVAHESRWPYKIRKFDAKPPANVYVDALKFRALEYQRVDVSTFAVRTALAQKHPVIIGLSLFESFESLAVSRTGMVPMPNLSREQMIGGHCMYVVGYGQRDGHFTVRNSWNTDWGDKGDCYMPEQMLGSPDYGSDYWIVQAAGIASGT